MAPRKDRRVLLLGAASQLGFALVRRYGPRALTPVCSEHTRHRGCEGWPRVNLEDADGLARIVGGEQVDLILHCGGICDVDRCESWPDFAWAVNVESVRALLRVMPQATRLVYCSSDHVFGGGRGPYRESDPHHPLSVYGRTRCAAEALIASDRPDALIVRYGLGIGPSLSGKSGHLDWLRYRTRRGLPTTVIVDEVRSAVWAAELAERVWELSHSRLTGVRHVVATRAASRLRLARYLSARFGIGADLTLSTRCEQATPHIGNVELGTVHTDHLATPLRAVVEG